MTLLLAHPTTCALYVADTALGWPESIITMIHMAHEIP